MPSSIITENSGKQVRALSIRGAETDAKASLSSPYQDFGVDVMRENLSHHWARIDVEP
jgi:hypothetical protein